MLATVSPCNVHAEETLATLRYACQARTIVNRVRVNEDPNDRLIRDLRAEVDRLTALKEVFEHHKKHPLGEGDNGMSEEIHRKEQEIRRLKEQLKQSQEYLSKSDRSWSERLQEAEQRKSAELKYLKQCGLAVHLDWNEQQPCLVNLTADPILSGTLFYLLPPGIVQIGRQNSGVEDDIPDICLNGPLVRRKHCTIQNLGGSLSLIPGSDGQTFVNGKMVNIQTSLHHGDRVVIGGNHYFRVNHPQDPKAKVIDHPIDYQFAYQEIHRIQESKLEAELEEAKRNALKELEETRKEAEMQLGSQRFQFEQQLQQLGTTLEMHKDALSEISRKKEELEIEKHILEAEVESHKLRRASTVLEDSFVIAPYKTNFLQEVEDILNGTLCETETVLRSNPNEVSKVINLHDMQVMIQEAKQLSKELGIPYDFSHEHVVGENALQQRVKVRDRSKCITAFWQPSYFSHWVDRLRHHDPDDSLKELLNHDHIEWTEDLEISVSEDSTRIMVNTKNVKRQLNESILQLSMESCESVMDTGCESSESDSLDDNHESICGCIEQMENTVQDLRILCNGQNKEVIKKLNALNTVIKDLKAVLQISSTKCLHTEVNESSFNFKFPVSNTPPAKSNLRSPGHPGQDTPKIAKSVRFLLSESQQLSSTS
ncbi:Kinesin-like protein unc-104 [Gryllus bimaculatus]|nr:Kinesin-like protein unc-104 [Gryllus bimaculatus]